MATTALKGTPVHTNRDLPATGSADFVLVGIDLSEKTLADFEGKKKILTINPSYDTPVCQTAARTFNQRAAALDGVVVLVISPDLPFAQKRFCVAEGLDGVVPLSTFRSFPSGLRCRNGRRGNCRIPVSRSILRARARRVSPTSDSKTFSNASNRSSSPHSWSRAIASSASSSGGSCSGCGLAPSRIGSTPSASRPIFSPVSGSCGSLVIPVPRLPVEPPVDRCATPAATHHTLTSWINILFLIYLSTTTYSPVF